MMATTVIEVGVNVPNATIMVIVHTEGGEGIVLHPAVEREVEQGKQRTNQNNGGNHRRFQDR